MCTTNQTYITVGIPFYNAESTLLDAVRSIFAQTHKNWELILIDDGSTDNSLQLACSINDPRVTVYSDGKNLRLAARLNQIAQLAKYDFIARMDADDLISPLRLEKQLNLLQADSDIDLVSTGICSLNNNYEPVGIRSIRSEHILTPKKLLLGASGIVHASILGRSSWFKRNPYDENIKLSEDHDLWIRAFSNNDLSIAFIAEPLYYYREDSSVTREKLLLSYATDRRIIINDAKNKFKLYDRFHAITRNLAKTSAIKYFPNYALKLARKRRNVEVLSKANKMFFENEIAYIRNVNLTITNPKVGF